MWGTNLFSVKEGCSNTEIEKILHLWMLPNDCSNVQILHIVQNQSPSDRECYRMPVYSHCAWSNRHWSHWITLLGMCTQQLYDCYGYRYTVNIQCFMDSTYSQKTRRLVQSQAIVFSCGAWKESDLASGWKDTWHPSIQGGWRGGVTNTDAKLL